MSKSDLETKRIAIIGGGGKMGRWLASFLSNKDYEVVLTDIDAAKLSEAGRQLKVPVSGSNEVAIAGADYIILSVPIDAIEPVSADIGVYVKGWQTVVDITSIKTVPVKAMHKHIRTGLVLGGHPLFGPGAASIDNKNIIFTPTSDEENDLAERLKGFFERAGARVSLMSPAEHDRLMGLILGLSHFIALAAADTLLELGNLHPMEAAGSSTYKVLMTLIESVLSEDPDLYAAIQMGLPDVREYEELFKKKTTEWVKLVGKNDRTEFSRRMKSLQQKLEKEAPDFQKSYEKMYRIVEGL